MKATEPSIGLKRFPPPKGTEYTTTLSVGQNLTHWPNWGLDAQSIVSLLKLLVENMLSLAVLIKSIAIIFVA